MKSRELLLTLGLIYAGHVVRLWSPLERLSFLKREQSQRE